MGFSYDPVLFTSFVYMFCLHVYDAFEIIRLILICLNFQILISKLQALSLVRYFGKFKMSDTALVIRVV